MSAFTNLLRSLGAALAYITGATGVGNVLTANLAPAAGTATTWQWTRNGTNISGATSSTYTQVTADLGTIVGVLINGAYTASVSVPGIAPAVTTAPSVSSATTSAGLTWTPGVYTGTPMPTVVASVYVNNNLVASNVTQGSYTPTLVGGSLVVTEVPTNSAGSVSSSSAPVTITNASPNYDIVLLAGQSNMSGRGVVDPALDVADARVFQFGGYVTDSATYRQIVATTTPSDPLTYPDIGQGSTALGPAMAFARHYETRTGRKVLLVPAAWGGTSMVGGTPRWSPYGTNNDLYLSAIDQANRAINAAVAAFPGSAFVGTLWSQGESDGDTNVTQVQYQTALKDLIAGFRAGITGGSSSWFVIGGMMPEAITVNGGGAGTTYAQVEAGLSLVGGAVPKAAYFASPSGYDKGDHLHFNAAGQRVRGPLFDAAIATALANAGDSTPGQVTGLTAGTATSSTMPLTWTAPASGGAVRDYDIQYALAGSGSWSTIVDGVSTTAAATVNGLTANTSYDFRVRATNYATSPAGAYSATLTASTAASGLADAFVRLTSITGTKITESGSAGAGWTYTATNGAVFASDHAGVSSLKMPAGVSGSIRGAITTTASVNNWILGLVTSQTDPAYSAGATGYKFGLIAANTGNYKVIVDGGSSTVTPNGNAAFAVQVGDIMQLSRSGSTILAQVARSAAPTTFTTIHTFVSTSAADLWCAITANSNNTSAIGPLIGNGWA